MDDFIFILNDKGSAPAEFRLDILGQSFGSSAEDAKVVTVFQTIPVLLTLVTGWLFPLNPVAAHFWNLLIHLIFAVLIFSWGGRLLRLLDLMETPEIRNQAALVGALIFACHPLGTEPVHYAKCHMVQLVALFGFWATCEAAEYLAFPNRRAGFRFLIATGLCVLSYFPGTVMLGFNLAALVLFNRLGKSGDLTARAMLSSPAMRRPAVLVASGLAGSAILYLAYFFLSAYGQVITNWGEIYPTHIVTQGRVFWEYFQRIFVPVNLASDHFQPWSTFRDPVAVAKLIAFAALLLISAWFVIKKGSPRSRSFHLLLLLALIPFAIRMLYVNIEIMVEYRAYNALPWIALLFGCGLTKISVLLSSSKLRWLPTAAVVVIFMVLSVERGRVWRSAGQLAENVLTQYPLNNRSRVQLQLLDLKQADPLDVLRLHQEAVEVREQINEFNIQSKGRVLIDPIRSNLILIASYQFAVYATAEVAGPTKALAFADESITTLKKRLPASFVNIPNQTQVAAWPLLEAREVMARRNLGNVTGKDNSPRTNSESRSPD
ncbi:MAG: hypothetical protein V4675_17940 [Verrucomicrobiota bacterium]